MEPITYSVADLGVLIRAALEHTFPDDLWVAGEVRNLSRPKTGHVYFDLVEPASKPGAQPEATISVTLFRDTKEIVNQALRRHGGMRIQDGMLVRIRGVLDFFAPRGRLNLRMTGIDPGYTLGAMAAEREALLRLLRAEGLIDANGRIPVPAVPLRVAVITSRGSAAEADFLHELRASGFSWQVTIVDSTVQGSSAEASLVRAVVTAERIGVDVVAIVRGGGSRTDLVCFDGEALARAIAGCSVPVITGIGHDIDRSVADEVAHTATKTPTACAALLVAGVRDYLDRLDDRARRLSRVGSSALDDADARLAGTTRHLATATRAATRFPDHLVRDRSRELVRRADRNVMRADLALAEIGRRARTSATEAPEQADRRVAGSLGGARATARAALDRASALLERAQVTSAALDPARIQARGWAMVLGRDGRLVRSVAAVDPGDPITMVLADGRLHGMVQEIEETARG